MASLCGKIPRVKLRLVRDARMPFSPQKNEKSAVFEPCLRWVFLRYRSAVKAKSCGKTDKLGGIGQLGIFSHFFTLFSLISPFFSSTATFSHGFLMWTFSLNFRYFGGKRMFSINYQVTKSQLIQFLMHISIFSGFCGILRNFAVFYGRVCGEAPKHSGIPVFTAPPPP